MTTKTETMQAFDLGDLLQAHETDGNRYLEFLRVPALSAGIYRLPAGGVDPQQPHAEDEVYYIVAGRSAFTCDGERIEVGPGTTIYVAAHAEHRFHDIADDLTILVLFAPAENE